MSEGIVWVLLRHNGAEEARQASNMNLAFVVADDPQTAREKAAKANPFGERYDAPNYAVVSLSAFMDHMGGTALVRGDLPHPVMWPKDASWVF
jgi:hypothetical protein